METCSPSTLVGHSHTLDMYTLKLLPCWCQACLDPQEFRKWEQRLGGQEVQTGVPGRVVSMSGSPLMLTFHFLSSPLSLPTRNLPSCSACNLSPPPFTPRLCVHCAPPAPSFAEGPGLPAAVAEGLCGCLREEHLTLLSGATQVRLELLRGWETEGSSVPSDASPHPPQARGGGCRGAAAPSGRAACAGRAAGCWGPGTSPAAAQALRHPL